MPEISVIISTFNRSSLLKKAIKSVLSQTFGDFELIIVDDNSTDDTEKVVKSFKDERIKYFKLEKNHGTDSYPKNYGIKKSQGKYICFLDDDDIFRRDHLQVLYNQINNSDYDLVYGDYIWINEDGRKDVGISLDFNLITLTKINFISMVTVIVKKEALYDVGGFDETIPKFKDWNLWIRLAKRGYKFKHIPIIISEILIHKNSISNKYPNDYLPSGQYLPTYFDPVDCDIFAQKTCLANKKDLKVAVFTLTKDRIELTKETFRSMKEMANYPFDLFVVDQGSKDGTIEYLKEMKEKGFIKDVIFNEKNVGISKGSNQALDLIGKEYDIIGKVDNDCLFLTFGWLKSMINLFECNRQIVLSPYVEGLKDNAGGVLRQNPTGLSPYFKIKDFILGMTSHLGGICVFAPVEAYKDFRWEENDFYSGIQDFIFSQHCLKNGFSLFYMEEHRVEHMLTTKGQQEKYKDYFELRKIEQTTKYEPDKI